jgi:hypothetical protein
MSLDSHPVSGETQKDCQDSVSLSGNKKYRFSEQPLARKKKREKGV